MTPSMNEKKHHLNEMNKGTTLFFILGGFFIANTLVAEFIGVKIFALEDTLGISRFNINLFGQEGAGMSDEGIKVCEVLYEINQYGSTRSMNASAAGAIAMYHWALQHLPK
jgi:tRNA(Leu) C34 or U34 (ribose-2'-O)-methylase TrmL